jgi:phosphate starvation-inducible PhoH-like protein
MKLDELDYAENQAGPPTLTSNKDKGYTIRNKYTLNDVHKSFLDLCLYDKTKMVLVDGSAGTAKTYLSVLAGLTLLKDKKIDHIVYIRSIVESATKSIGALPGEVDEKFKPWSLPMLDKLHELIHPNAAAHLISDGLVKCVPVNFVRGLTFHDSLVIVDESQNLTKDELVTILTRFGQNTRYVVIGDSKQKDIGKLSGFAEIANRFDDKESSDYGIHSIKFGENEIVRSQILKFIVKKLGC